MKSQLISLKLGTLGSFIQQRKVSILSRLRTTPVLVSSNTDVYTNLALEHWLYNNLKFQKIKTESTLKDNSNVFRQPVVLLWTDEPCIVIGRHQNPWIESTLGFVNKAGIKLARRHSGGGCVYHDENNINVSIIGDRADFENRQENLRFLAKVFEEKYGIKCEPNKRHDLVHSETGLKISGSAAKLGRYNSYHHFTVLVDTDKDALYTAIRQNQQDFIRTNSSLSTRAKVINLREIKKELDPNQVINDLANAYGELYGCETARSETESSSRVEGDLSDFKSLSEYKDELQSWDWIYGKTPAFKLNKSLTLFEGGIERKVNFNIQINKGLFSRIEIDSELTGTNPTDKFNYLIGSKFTYKDAMVNVTKLLNVDESLLLGGTNSIGTQTLFATFLLQMIQEANF